MDSPDLSVHTDAFVVSENNLKTGLDNVYVMEDIFSKENLKIWDDIFFYVLSNSKFKFKNQIFSNYNDNISLINNQKMQIIELNSRNEQLEQKIKKLKKDNDNEKRKLSKLLNKVKVRL